MNGSELFEEYKLLSPGDQVVFEKAYHEHKDNVIINEYNELDLLERRLSIASQLQSIFDKNGNPYFDVEWIVKNIFHLSDEEIEIATGRLKKI